MVSIVWEIFFFCGGVIIINLLIFVSLVGIVFIRIVDGYVVVFFGM